MISSTVIWYNENASRLASLYEKMPAIVGQEWLADLLPMAPGTVIDIGAGSGRDASAFAEAGYEVVAVEPSDGMIAKAKEFHGSAKIRWISDSMPSLKAISNSGVAADLLLVGAVWHHLQPADRPRAFRKLTGLMRSGGLMVITLRHGPDDGRGTHPVSLGEIESLARDNGLQVLRAVKSSDFQQRDEVSWTNMALRLPDDGTGALPLLRHLILTDAKSATYKLGLLRVLCRIADGAAGLAVDEDEYVKIPLGLVALYWLRLYLPLTLANLPQTPGNVRGAEGLGFAGEGWRALSLGAASPRDLRIGHLLSEPVGPIVHAALREAVDLICRMPAKFLTYPAGGQILKATRNRLPARNSPLVLDGPTLDSFGSMRLPKELWTVMKRFSVWVEPALVSEWTRLMQSYATSQGRLLDIGAIAVAMTWSDPVRDVAVPRARATALIMAGHPVYCVWSGKRLVVEQLDIDHCLPWSAWPCGDLWNLLPTDRRVNQHGKRDRLPSAEALQSGGDRIEEWWSVAYLNPETSILRSRFAIEASASLPSLGHGSTFDTEQVQDAMALQRLRLYQDQGIPEWTWKA